MASASDNITRALAGVLPNRGQSFQREARKFINAGMCLTSPVDLLPANKLAYGRNVRGYLNSPIQSRPGLQALLTGTLPDGLLHSIRRLNDDSEAYGDFTRIFGIGTGLYYGQTTATLVDNTLTGYFSGNPLSLIEFRPVESPDPWIYVADSILLWKTDLFGNGRPVGYKPPGPVPRIAFAYSTANNVQPYYPFASIAHTYINTNADEVNTDWAQSGTAGAPSTLTGATGRVNPAAVSITKLTYDSGALGWACIQPTTLAGIAPGIRLRIDPGGASDDDILVESVNPGSTASTTIGSIIYDSGTTGDCSVQLADPLDFLERDAYINDSTVGGANGLTRAISVTVGPDGLKSMRLHTAATWSVGDTVSILPSFRAVTSINHAAGETLGDSAVRTAVTVGTGSLTQTLAINLGRIANLRPTQPSDWLRLSVRFDNPANVTQVRIALDVDASVNTFTQNYYFYAFRPSDLTPAIRLTSTFAANAPTVVQRNVIDNYDPATGQYVNTTDENGNIVSSTPLQQTGDNQWYEVWFRVSDLTRVGADGTRTLSNVAAIQISYTVTATTNCDLDSFLLCGSYGPDALQSINGYLYRYRIRDSSTGARSRWSQPSRSEVFPIRQRVTLTVAGSTTVGVDKIDFQRFGAERPIWTYIGTTTNDPGGGDVSFNDDFSDDAISSNPTGDDDVRAPFPVSDEPQSGTGYSAGTTLIASTGSFSGDWVRGMTINVNGIDYTVAIVNSTTKLETLESMGTQGSSGSPIKWYAPRPVLEHSPMPSMWGPVDGIIYACADTRNQGTLYGTANNDADSAPETNQIEVTSPSEPLIAGCAYDSGSYVFSDRRMFRIIRNPDFFATATEVPNGKGLFSQWGLVVGPSIWFLGKDGIYETKGGEPQSITDLDLYPLFPHDGIFPSAIALDGGITIQPPQMNISPSAVASHLRLSYYDSMLYFDYLGIDDAYYTLIYNTITKAWFIDTYARIVNLHYGESGHGIRNLFACGQNSLGTKGQAYEMLPSIGDDGDDIPCAVLTPSLDRGDPHLQKLWQDTLLDADPDGIPITVTQLFNQNTTALTPQVALGPGRDRFELENNGGAGTQAYNASLLIEWTQNVCECEGGTPSITSLSPDQIDAGNGDFTMSVYGMNFRSDAVVKWNGTTLATTFISSTQLNAVVTAGLLASISSATVTVNNPDPGCGVSNNSTFDIICAGASPTITSLSPATCLAGSGAFTLTVYGTNFDATSVVRWGASSRATTLINPTQLTSAILAGDVTAAGTVSVDVNNVAPGCGVSNASDFSVTDNEVDCPALNSHLQRDGSTGCVIGQLYIDANTGCVAGGAQTPFPGGRSFFDVQMHISLGGNWPIDFGFYIKATPFVGGSAFEGTLVGTKYLNVNATGWYAFGDFVVPVGYYLAFEMQLTGCGFFGGIGPTFDELTYGWT